MLLQDVLGARWFLPRGVWFPEREHWDWHPVLPAADVEGGAQENPDCAICLEKIELRPSTGADDGEKDGVGATFNRWSYMVPPCHHITHTTCLEGWLAVKSVCPVCRRPLPPV